MLQYSFIFNYKCTNVNNLIPYNDIFFYFSVMLISLVSALNFVAGTVTKEITSIAGLVSLLLIATAFPNSHLRMVMLLWMLPLILLLTSSWKLQQTQLAMHGSMPLVKKMGMLADGTLSTRCTVQATTTTWWLMA